MSTIEVAAPAAALPKNFLRPCLLLLLRELPVIEYLMADVVDHIGIVTRGGASQPVGNVSPAVNVLSGLEL